MSFASIMITKKKHLNNESSIIMCVCFCENSSTHPFFFWSRRKPINGPNTLFRSHKTKDETSVFPKLEIPQKFEASTFCVNIYINFDEMHVYAAKRSTKNNKRLLVTEIKLCNRESRLQHDQKVKQQHHLVSTFISISIMQKKTP